MKTSCKMKKKILCCILDFFFMILGQVRRGFSYVFEASLNSRVHFKISISKIFLLLTCFHLGTLKYLH